MYSVVRAAKQKLSDYASETLTSVSKYFSHLHGLLQVAEQRVIEELRESSLPPQMELNEAMGTLSVYEALIKHLMQYLDNGSETKMGVPNNIRLEEIINLVEEHLQKIPNTVQISQIKINPYRIYSEHIDIPSIIKQKFKCKFIDPNIKVSFKTDFECNSTISSINNAGITFYLSSSCGKENDTWSNVNGPRQQQHQQQPFSEKDHFNSMSNSQKRQSNKSSINSIAGIIDSFQQRNHHQLDFVDSFLALDIAKPNNTTRGPEVGDWIKTYVLVKVRFINSPEDFYVQGVQAAQRVREELETFAQSLTVGHCNPPEIVVGQHYIIFHQDQNAIIGPWSARRWPHRTPTRSCCLTLVSTSRCTIASEFREMPQHLSHIPYSAVHCRLSELMPGLGPNSEWAPEAITHLKQIVKNNSVHLIVKKALSHDLHEVDLITKNYNTNISICKSFLYSGLARSRCGRPPAVVLKLLQLDAPNNLRLPRPKLQIGDVFMIQMVHVEHPQEFYVMRHDLEGERCLKQSNLQRYMDFLNLSTLEHIFMGRLHLGCVVQLNDGQWKRASIEEILFDGYVLVRLVDDGPCQKIFWDKLFVLPSEFWEPERTIRCCLADVETLQNLSYVWTPEATAFFKQLTSNPKLHIEVINFTDDVVYVALRYTRGVSETTNVAVQMVAQGHCTSSGESSRMFTNTQSRVKAMELTPFREPEAEDEDRNKRVKVKVLYIRHPHEFYVTLPQFLSQIEHLQKTMQTAAEAMSEDQMPRTDWKVGDMCFVKVQAQSDLAPFGIEAW
ncbi:uncharacterized protein LOC110183673 [Drosophila serrata]|uniref:uncharacterized protein LOC110183673 n=1 Tax=Drosophila serrata TaxID=7274 RepID=UPI000A1CF4DB|nr:uncharacterized protein LOC110183673 [Drosophila serrata]